MSKPIIVSGIQPTGQLHIGNYLGALNNWIKIQNSDEYQCLFFIADYHSLSENYDPKIKKQQIINLTADFLAAGLDPKKSIIFAQSQVPECTELCWIFNTITPLAELERMTQFKDKAGRQEKNINLGLFDYPVLQAADILLYRGSLVPVGQDQVQHVELTRDCARWFNNKYQTEFFPESKPLLTETPKIMSLITPEKKMSKSLGEKHWLGIDEAPEEIAGKLAKAVSTPEGIENLKSIYNAFGEKMSGQFNPEKMSDTKKIIAQGIADYFAEFRQKKAELLKNENEIIKILADGQAKAAAIAQDTMKEVKKIIGLI